ncbi:hypothetical protein CP973_24215 [Streptomyces albofaciens JCM 4342]|uniref:serine hydrolase n=1 Tax=Streptomyces albofaciens TaxID=66866 RepID=UPI0012389E62|nr:serine hydrolase [Streptomyces albofaciens]KAA6212499.1 hypothetical protein CP973_24215 [Streptomyces albofaciens JCM 4342]
MRWLSVGVVAVFGTGAAAGPAVAAAPSAATQRAVTAGPSVHCTSKNAELARKLAGDISKALAGRKSMASLSFYDRPTATKCTFDADKQYDSASVVKTVILGALLYEKGGTLTGTEDALARKMITVSDNAATTTLWRQLSDLTDPKKPDPVKVQKFLDKAGMRDTVLDKEGNWGLTQVTAADQDKLLRLLSGDDDSVLRAGARSYALGLMRQVQSDQRWGATAGAPADAVIQVKNGWLQRSRNPDVPDFDKGDWKVNSMAVLTGKGYDSGLVVLTENNRVPEGRPTADGMNYGIGTIEAISRAIYRAVHPGAKRYSPSAPAPAAVKPSAQPPVTD